MEFQSNKLRNPDSLLRLATPAQAIRDVIHDRIISSAAIFNFEMGFDLTPQQTEVLNTAQLALLTQWNKGKL